MQNYKNTNSNHSAVNTKVEHGLLYNGCYMSY